MRLRYEHLLNIIIFDYFLKLNLVFEYFLDIEMFEQFLNIIVF